MAHADRVRFPGQHGGRWESEGSRSAAIGVGTLRSVPVLATVCLLWLACISLGCALSFGCTPTGSQETPEAVGRVLVHSLDRTDAVEFLSILPQEDRLAAAFDCGRSDSLRAALVRRRSEARSEFEARRAAGLRVRLDVFAGPGSETVDLTEGDFFQSCTVRLPVTVHRAHVSLTMSKGGRSDSLQEVWTFLRFDPAGSWYYAKL